MTEYDYSPEAYDRYLATQTRIADWVDTTESHRAEFQHALNAVPPTAPTVKVPSPPAHARPAHARRPPPLPLPPFGAAHAMGSHALASGGMPSGMSHGSAGVYYTHGQQPRSASSDGYERGGPGPMPLPTAGMRGYAPPSVYAPMLPPGAHQAMLYRPGQTHRSSHQPSHAHRHGQGSGRRHHSAGGGYYTMASPPVSPYGPYGAYVPQQQGGYFMVQPQQAPVMPSQWMRPTDGGYAAGPKAARSPFANPSASAVSQSTASSHTHHFQPPKAPIMQAYTDPYAYAPPSYLTPAPFAPPGPSPFVPLPGGAPAPFEPSPFRSVPHGHPYARMESALGHLEAEAEIEVPTVNESWTWIADAQA